MFFPEEWDGPLALEMRLQRRSRKSSGRVPSAVLWRRTAWLESPVAWRDGQVQFQIEGRWRSVFDTELERTNRALRSLERREFVDTEFDVKARRRLWSRAVKLSRIEAPNLERLCSVSRRRNPAALARLGELLRVEVSSLGALEASPARALVAAWPHSRAVLEAALDDPDAQILAAWCLGACGVDIEAEAPLRRVARLARVAFTGEPLLAALAARESETTFWRLKTACEFDSCWRISPARERMLALQHGVGRLIEITETLTRVPAFFPTYEPNSWLLPEDNARVRRAWKSLEREICARLAPQIEKLALQNSEAPAEAVNFVREWLETLISLRVCPDSSGRRWQKTAIGECLIRVLREFGPLPVDWLARVTQSDAPLELLRLLREAWPNSFQSELKSLLKEKTEPTLTQIHRAKGRAVRQTISPLLNAGAVDVAGARELFTLGALGLVRYREIPSRGWLEVALFAARRGAREENGFYANLFWARKVWASERDDGSAGALRLLRRWCNALAALPSEKVWDLVDAATGSDLSPHAAISVWRRVEAPLGVVARLWAADEERWNTDDLKQLIYCVSDLLEALPREWDDERAVQLAVRLVENLWHQVSPRAAKRLRRLAEFALENALSRDGRDWDEEIFLRTIEAALPRLPRSWDARQNAVRGARVLRHVADARDEVQFALVSALKVGSGIYRTLDAFAALGRGDVLNGATLWPSLNVESPGLPLELTELGAKWALWSARAGVGTDLPREVREALEAPQKWARERDFLREKIEKEPSMPLRKRLESLEARLCEAQSETALARRIAAAREALEAATERAAAHALSVALQNLALARLEKLGASGENADEIEAERLEALLLWCEERTNRRWTRELLLRTSSADADAVFDWRMQLPGNARFLNELQSRGADRERFVAAWKWKTEKAELWIERDPLKILPMGRYFGTCLSRGGCNAHSPIANALDLNKIVVYARDENGKIVARQLWAVTRDGTLVGFHIYSHASNQEARQALEKTFATCAREFAASCRLMLTNDGEIESLVVPHWYDDGICAWEKVSAEC